MDDNPQLLQICQKLKKYEKMEQNWNQEKEIMTRNIALLQEEITKHKAINANLLKNSAHKRTYSEQGTFIFNQTNISSYFPVIMMNKTHNWVPRANLRSHLDSVRAVHWQGQFLLTAGQDCLLKIWNKNQLKITVRQHLGPIFTICGDNESIFTAGGEGVVREWSVSGFLQNNKPVAEAEFHDDIIWEIVWNKNNRILITSCSEGIIKSIKSTPGQLKQINQISTFPDTPTSIAFLGDQKIVSGWVQTKKLSIFDLEKSKKKADMFYQSKEQMNQANKIVYFPHSKIIVSAHQDRIIRFIDPHSGKCVKNLVAHSDSVTSLCFRGEQQQLISCSHDGSVRIWDIRKFKCVHDIGIHMQKYDESLLCVAHGVDENILAVGGADGQVKLISPQI